jgi:hypothetical protein
MNNSIFTCAYSVVDVHWLAAYTTGPALHTVQYKCNNFSVVPWPSYYPIAYHASVVQIQTSSSILLIAYERFISLPRDIGILLYIILRGRNFTAHSKRAQNCIQIVELGRFLVYILACKHVYSSVGTARGYGLGRPRDRGLISGRGRQCSLFHSVQTGFRANPTSYSWVPGALSPRLMDPGC